MAPGGLMDSAADADWRVALASLEGAYARGTLRELVRHLDDFAGWCARRNAAVLPALPQTVADHVLDIFPRYSARSVAIRLAAVRRLHQLCDLPDPTRTFSVQLAYRTGLRRHGGPPRQVNALNAPLRDRLLAACPDTLPGLRDRVLIGLGYDTLCRVSELVELLVEDLVDLPDGTGHVLVRHSKPDPFGRGEIAFVSAPTMRELQSWLGRAGLDEGPILRRFFRGGSVVGRKRMNESAVGKIVKAAALRAGVDRDVVARLSSHSMRVGAAQDLAIAGRSLVEIMRAGRWKHLDAVALYVRDAPVNVWAGSDADTYPVTQGARVWRGFRRGGKPAPLHR